MYLQRPENSVIVDRVGTPYCFAAICEMHGQRLTQEDAHCMHFDPVSNRTIFGVFDGHNGARCSRFVAEHLPQMIAKLQSPITLETIRHTFFDLDEMCKTVAGGTTAATAIIEQSPDGKSHVLYVAHVGDSRIIVIRNGQIICVTDDHKPTDPEERERIKKVGHGVYCARVDGNLAVSRAFGDFEYKDVTHFPEDMLKDQKVGPECQAVTCNPTIQDPIQLCKNDIIVIHCDGITEGDLPPETVAELVTGYVTEQRRPVQFTNTPVDLGAVATTINDAAINRGTRDNLSCMVIRYGHSGLSALSLHGARSYIPGNVPELYQYRVFAAFHDVAKHVGFPGQALNKRLELIAKLKNSPTELEYVVLNRRFLMSYDTRELDKIFEDELKLINNLQVIRRTDSSKTEFVDSAESADSADSDFFTAVIKPCDVKHDL